MAIYDMKGKQIAPDKMVFSTLEGKMVPTGQDMWQCSCGRLRYYKESPGQAWQHEVSYHGACGYCKCDPCQCGGHGFRP